jgi:uncharacterized protein (TIGR00304 family)
MQKLLAAGFAIIVAGMILLVVSAAGQGSVSAGGVVFIGPFPIVFGSGQNGGELALISVVIGAIMVVFTLLWFRSASLLAPKEDP